MVTVIPGLDELTEAVAELRACVAGARRAVVLSGAGMSAESGVPTFREVQTGLWERFSPEDLATTEAFEAHPDLVWTWYRWRQALIGQVAPNPGHVAVARWQQYLSAHGGSLSVVTQNVDDLHERAGAQVLAHLHGTISAHRCFECGMPHELPAPEGNGQDMPPAAEQPPACTACGGYVRPGVVWFGEMLPMDAFDDAAAAVRAADCVVVVGTSGIVQPAASLPLLALERGSPLIEVNPQVSELTELMDYSLRGPSGVLLPQLLNALQD